MINQHAVNQINDLYSNIDDVFTRRNAVFTNNVTRYLELKGLLHQVNVSQDPYFQSRFTYFYGLNHISANRRGAFYQKFEEIKNAPDRINVRELTEQLAEPLGKQFFSFCSKMANLIDDERYPIYDSHIAEVFHRPGLGYGVDYKANLYHDVIDTYGDLIDHPLIELFRTRFHAGEMGYMKVLDALFWAI